MDDAKGADNDLTSVSASEFYPYPVGDVWRVLVSLELTAEQARKVSDNPVEVGQTRVLTMYPMPSSDFDGVVHVTYTSVVPEDHIEYTLTAPGVDFKSRWSLHSEQDGTRLHLEHSRFDPENPQHRQWRSMLYSGVAPVLQTLHDLLNGGR